MPLIRLIYASQLTEKCNLKTLQKILESSRKNNAKDKISGILCYDPSYFMQWLEGPREKVNRLYHTILNDDRHENVQILEYCEISSRSFESWSMAYVSTNDVNQRILFKYSSGEIFNPFAMHGESARHFLLEMAGERKAFLDQMISQIKKSED